ncbi:MAG TPA: anthranilate phosphoribosyltransferase [Bryobacteraceae bacterium]|nr:anthranilate phosphoribosyltransferase [Bryobacteraceae bacterium]
MNFHVSIRAAREAAAIAGTLHYIMPILPHLERVVRSENLSSGEAQEAMEAILAGAASHAQIAAFLVALRMKGETVEELVGFARAMRRMAALAGAWLDLADGEPLLDTCGTGGDGAGTFNISTIAAFVVAGAGVRVAKHGNRSISSRCGSADLLESLGVVVAVTAERAAAAIREVGIGFLFAPAMHTAMKHAHAVRTELKLRTVFNLLGPLTNPAGANAQLAGAPSPQAAELMANALAALGLARGFVVHGSDGLDEITTTGPTAVFEIANGGVRLHCWRPEDFGVQPAPAAAIKGGDAMANAAIAREVLAGCRGPRRDIVLVNAAAALIAAGKAGGLAEAMRLAAASLDSGAAAAKLAALAEFTRAEGPA